MLTILDVIVVAHFGFGAHLPWWLWVWAVLNEIGAGELQMHVRKTCKVILKKGA